MISIDEWMKVSAAYKASDKYYKRSHSGCKLQSWNNNSYCVKEV